MNDGSLLERFETYLDRLDRSLTVSAPKKREIVDEIRSDLLAQVKRHQGAGKSEAEAVDLALEEMGDPNELAHSLSEVVPPLSTGPVKVLRILAAGGLIAWTLYLLWNIRAWTYGVSPGISAGLIAFHLSLILLVWPGIIWRRNWLFGLVPAGICLVLFLVLQVVGMSQTSSQVTIPIEISPEGEVQAPAEAISPEPPESPIPPALGYSVLVGLLGATALLFYLMQRPRQRRVAIVAALLALLFIEGYFFLDEVRFRKERDRLLELVSQPHPGDGGPLEESELGERPGVRINLSPGQDAFTLFWARPLASGYSLCYSSETDRHWVND